MKKNKSRIKKIIIVYGIVLILSIIISILIWNKGSQYSTINSTTNLSQTETTFDPVLRLEQYGINLFDSPISIKSVDKFNNILINGQLTPKITLINFWQTSCIPCKEEIYSLNILNNTINKDLIKIMLINIDETKSKTEQYLHDLNNTLKSVIMTMSEYNKFLEKTNLQEFSNILPQTYLINNEGFIIAGLWGAINWQQNQIPQSLNSLTNNDI